MRKQTVSMLTMGLLWPLLASMQAQAATACRADTATQIPVTGLKGSLQNPCFSPNGEELVFTNFTTRYNTGNAIVRAVSAAGGAPYATLLSPTNAQSVNLPGQCWSAASNEVAYSSDVGDHDEIYLAPAGGGASRQITSRPNDVAWEPSVSPVLADGSRWIVFESHPDTDADTPGTLWKVRTDGSGLVQLTSGFDDRQPQWSPRGDRIVFQRQISTDNWDVMTIDVNGGNLANVTNKPSLSNTDPSWSPSGDYIVYSAGGTGIKIANLFVIPAAGGTPTRITSSCGLDGAPGWSADGSRIAFESAEVDPDTKGSTTLWVIDAPAGVR